MIEAEELRAACQRIIQSGELVRSRTYAAILEYLAEQAIVGSSPKEISIAMDVLGRDADFDVGKDSIVRVHIYHLRNKLNTYYAKHGKKERYRLDIPKGQYMLAATRNDAPGASPEEARSISGELQQRRPLTPWLAAGAIVLLLFNLFNRPEPVAPDVAPNPFAVSPLWAALLDDDLPVLVLVGDYYIMGEVDETGRVSRMVREFDINSSLDLRLQQQGGHLSRYLNLDLNYTPTSIPIVLASVMQVFAADAGRVKVKLMSDFNTNDLVGNHVVYLGYLSGLEGLRDLVFAASGLATGLTFDELVNIDSNERYQSSSGLSTGDSGYRDYGLLRTFPTANGAQYLFLAGMRDEGLVNLAEALTITPQLPALESLAVGADGEAAFEALYEVRGFNHTNFETTLVYASALDTRLVWQNRLLGTGL